ncbi:MAG: DoxX family protein [Acidobacteriota bacterium]
MSGSDVNPSAGAAPSSMPSEAVFPSPSTVERWIGRGFTALTVLCLLFDAAGKFVLPQHVVDASIRLGLPVHLNFALAMILTVATLLFLLPATAVLGAVMLTGYLGGAVAIQLRAGNSGMDAVFPVLFGCVVWAAILLRDVRLRQVSPLRLHRYR